MSTPPPRTRTEADGTVDVSLTVNGSLTWLSLPPRVTLSDALRDHLGLTGTHVGCEHGVCGMCTVIVDGEAARACLLFACQLEGAEVLTVEGLGRPDDLHPLQDAFGHHHALQCGFCTPGFLLSAYDLLKHEPTVARDDLPAELSGVLCRCTGYRNIVDAVDEVAVAHRDGLPGPRNCGPHTLVGRTPAGARPRPGPPGPPPREPVEHGRPQVIELPSDEPTFTVEVSRDLAAAPDQVGRVLEDIRLLAGCLPGAELTDELGDGWYRGQARVGLGPIRLAFQGTAHLLEQHPDRLHVLAQGRDAGGGQALAEIRLHASPLDAGTTRLQANASVFLTGRIAGFGRSLAGDVTQRLFEDFADAVEDTATGRERAGPADAPSAVRLVVSTLLARVRGLLRRLFGR
ncbi:MAG: 2Fe-2S iron-sulfur cluster-binding protein [Ilumatobacteraceae bacterium]